MPICFIHGVSVRKNDLKKDHDARQEMFEKFVLPTIKVHYPAFKVLDDIYWGDHGVKFRWKLTSMFGAKKPTAMGGAKEQKEADLARVVFELLAILERTEKGKKASSPSSTDSLDKVIVAAIKKDPEEFIRDRITGTVALGSRSRSNCRTRNGVAVDRKSRRAIGQGYGSPFDCCRPRFSRPKAHLDTEDGQVGP